jgi:hypothetical protein
MIILILSLLIFLPLIVYGIYKLIKPSTPNSPTTTPYQINTKQTTSSPTTTESPCTETDQECCKWKPFSCEANAGQYPSQQQWVKGLNRNDRSDGCSSYHSELRWYTTSQVCEGPYIVRN